MYTQSFLPEGLIIDTEENKRYLSSFSGIEEAIENETILEGMVTSCDLSHNLTVELGDFTGIIPRNESAKGIESGKTREIAIISRVGKPVAFTITGNKGGSLLLSRKRAQEKALSYIFSAKVPGDIIPARVTHLENFGAFVDIGCGNISLVGIENISVSRIAHPKERFSVGSNILAVISSFDRESERVQLTHRELLGTWEENANKFSVGETVRGIVRGVEEYGIFVELAPNLSGLAEWRDDVSIGTSVSVFIKSIIPEKMKIKLVIIDVCNNTPIKLISRSDYFLNDGRITRWSYSPASSERKKIETLF